MSPRRRRPWSDLTAVYRRRLERHGVTRQAYESGAPLTGARGHAFTPERPSRAERTPDRYRAYLRRQGTGMRMVTTEGVQILQGLSRAERSLVGAHDNAVRAYLGHGGEIGSPYRSRLTDFHGRTVRGYLPGSDDLADFEFETGEDHIDFYEGRGQIRFESIYESRS